MGLCRRPVQVMTLWRSTGSGSLWAVAYNLLASKKVSGDLNSQPKQPGDLDLWPFDLESGVRVICNVGYLCANFSLSGPLCSWLRPDVCDRQTSDRHTSDVRHASSLNASALLGRGHNKQYYKHRSTEIETANFMSSAATERRNWSKSINVTCNTNNYFPTSTTVCQKIVTNTFVYWNAHACVRKLINLLLKVLFSYHN